MAKLNELNCAEEYKNVGFGTCVLDPKLIAGAILFNTKRSFTAEELVDFQSTLQDAAWDDSPTSRTYPVHNFVQVTDNSEDVSIQTYDYGDKSITRDGFYDWLGQFRKGGLCLSSSLRSLNGDRFALFYDKNGVIFGYKANGLLTTIPVLFYEKPWKLATGSAATEYAARFIFEPKYLNEFVAYVKVDFDPAEITGLQDIEILVNSFDPVTGELNITLQTACGAVNLYDTYSAELNNVARYLPTNPDTGGAITVTSVTPNAGNKTFDLVLDVVDADYPDSGLIDFALQDPSDLNTAGIPGFESVATTLTVTSS